MSDVNLYQTNDGGEITIENGVVELSDGLPAAVYLSLFGGNEYDDGREDNPLKWWGNIDETDPARWAKSETQHILQSIPAIPANLRRVEDAATRDLAWLVDTGVAVSVMIEVTIPGLNRITIAVIIDGVRIEYSENWGS